jgi:hypothetical protein
MQSYVKTKHNFITTNKNIFDISKQRVNGDSAGCSIFVPHVCNNIDLFGAGFAAQVADKYPMVKANYHMLGKSFLQKNMGYSQIVEVYEEPVYKHKLFFVNMIAQNGIKNGSNLRPINYLGLVKAMNSLSMFISNYTKDSNRSEKVEIHCPKFGSGLAGGDWNFISYLIDDIWSKIPVIVYNYNTKISK